MKRLTLLLLAVLLLLIAAVPSSARPAGGKDTVRLKVFVHYPRPGRGKPPQPPRPPKPPEPTACDPTENDLVEDYGLAGWHLSGTVPYHINHSSIPGTVNDPQTAIDNSFNVWDSEAGSAVDFAYAGPTEISVAKNDGLHVVAWGKVSPGKAIAVTYIWYYPSTGIVVDVDTIMNVRLPWSYTSVVDPDQFCGDPYSYDAQNILTHELGHWMGLDDLYEPVDEDLTMYGYGDKGELKKETLGLGDILGIGDLY